MILQVDPTLVFLRETAILFFVYGIYVLSLNLEAGYLGLPQFGKVMFLALAGIAIGGMAVKLALILYLGLNPLQDIDTYCIVYQLLYVAEVTKVFASQPLHGVLFFVFSIVLAAVLAGVFGILMAGPALRLREDYLGIFLLVSAEAIRVVSTYTPQIACGVFGVYVPDPFAWFGEARQWIYALVVAVFFVVTFFVVERLANSPFGRALKAIRDAEVAARIFGKDIVKFRVKVLATASAMGGVAGALLVFNTNSVNMGQFIPLYTFIGWAMLIIGGLGNNIGAVLGVGAYLAIERLISMYKETIRQLVYLDPIFLQYIIFGVTIILILMYRPQGLVGEKPSRTLKNFRKTRPQ